MTKIFHNPRCSKSRQTLGLIQEKGISPEIIEYLKDVPTKEELKRVIHLLNITPEQLLRKNEDEYKQFKGKQLSDEEFIEAMIAYPKLIERPIVIHANKAVIGRPPEKVLEILA